MGEPEEGGDTGGFAAAVSELLLRTHGQTAGEVAVGALVLHAAIAGLILAVRIVLKDRE